MAGRGLKRAMHAVSIDLKRISTPCAFWLAAFLQLFQGFWLPTWHIITFAPMLVIACYQKELSQALWYSIAAGLFMDILQPHMPLGVHLLNYCAVTALLYQFRHYFFADSMGTLPLMSGLFACCSTLLAMGFWQLIAGENIFSWKAVAIDAFLLSAVDGVYAWALFIMPRLLWPNRLKRRRYYFLQRRLRR